MNRYRAWYTVAALLSFLYDSDTTPIALPLRKTAVEQNLLILGDGEVQPQFGMCPAITGWFSEPDQLSARNASFLNGWQIVVTTQPPRKVDLTIPLGGIDRARLLDDWGWFVPSDFQPIHISKFGDWFFAGPDGRIHRLNLTEGNLLQIAKSRGQFEAMKEDEQMRNDWFLAAFVLQCDAAGLLLKPDECYGWRVHPLIGGKLEFSNIEVFRVSAYQSLVAQLLQQRQNPAVNNVTPRESMTIPTPVASIDLVQQSKNPGEVKSPIRKANPPKKPNAKRKNPEARISQRAEKIPKAKPQARRLAPNVM